MRPLRRNFNQALSKVDPDDFCAGRGHQQGGVTGATCHIEGRARQLKAPTPTRLVGRRAPEQPLFARIALRPNPSSPHT
ncbi:MAG: hypothetical protein M3P40_02970 [Actinomycetota bacterium]|nr:hypothetical protein [Actinomycetota bacterium]